MFSFLLIVFIALSFLFISFPLLGILYLELYINNNLGYLFLILTSLILLKATLKNLRSFILLTKNLNTRLLNLRFLYIKIFLNYSIKGLFNPLIYLKFLR